MKQLDEPTESPGELIHDESQYDSSSWLVVCRYKPTQEELDEPPKSNRPTGVTIPVAVIVRPKHKGRTGPRGPIQVYQSLRQAIQDHGRWVRTATESQQPTPSGTASKVESHRIKRRNQ